MSTTEYRTVAILFSDVANYSQIEDDRLYADLKTRFERFAKENFSPPDVIETNTWGDGLFVVSNTGAHLLTLALRYQSFFSTTNWKLEGYPFHLAPRVGLHLEQATVHIDGSQITGVTGTQINQASRIEPVVGRGEIFCSETFHLLVREKAASNVQFADLGERPLAKDAGTMRLYSVTVSNHEQPRAEHPRPVDRPQTKVKIAKEFSQLERVNFLKQSFSVLAEHFSGLVHSLSDGDPDVEIVPVVEGESMRSYSIFVKGNKRTGAKIWLGDSLDTGIHFSSREDQRDTSMNETLYVRDDRYKLGLEPMGMFMTSRPQELLDPIGGAEYLFEGVARNLRM